MHMNRKGLTHNAAQTGFQTVLGRFGFETGSTLCKSYRLGWRRNATLPLYFLCSLITLVCVACDRPIDLDTDPRSLFATPTLSPTPTLTPTITPTAAPEKYTMAGFDQFIAEVEAAGRNDRQEIVNRYMVGIETTPFLIDGGSAGRQLILFLWQGAAFQVRLIGDMTQYVPENGIDLSQVADTDLWYVALELESDARLDYQFEVDGEPMLDRYNPHRIVSGFGVRSELRMPAYSPPPELQPGRQITTQHGTLTNDGLTSAILGYRRSFFVYTPAVPPLDGAKYPTVYFHDGTDYINLISTPLILDWLIEQGEIPPLVAVFVPPIDRTVEYDRNDEYVKFLTDELVPYVEENYGTSQDPAKTATFGASMGGLISVYAALNAPNVFGLVGSQSGALSFGNNALITQLSLQPPVPVRFHMIVGTYDTALVGRDEVEGNLLAANEAAVDLLRNKGYEFTYQTFAEGHSWGLWQAQIGNGLRYLFGPGEVGE